MPLNRLKMTYENKILYKFCLPLLEYTEARDKKIEQFEIKKNYVVTRKINTVILINIYKTNIVHHSLLNNSN